MLEVSVQERIGPAPVAPWHESVDSFSSSLCARIASDAGLVAIFNAARPALDEVLFCNGWLANGLRSWLARSTRDDQLFRTAMRQGGASGTANQGAWPEPNGSTVWLAYQMLPDSMSQRRWWYAAVARAGKPFDQEEIETLGLLLRQWKSHFNRPKESDMARLIVGHDDRLIHADPHGEQMLLDQGVSIDELMKELRQAADQRWPKLSDRQMHDVALLLNGRPWWICFRRQRAAPPDDAAYWYVEVRPLQKEELSPVGVVPDLRIARALGYIHDHFAESPSLNDVANAVHISPFHFHRLFSKVVGVTPKQYVLQKQIQVARWLLRSRNMPISRIAEETGFASHGHFTSTFRRFVGASPSQYRQAQPY